MKVKKTKLPENLYHYTSLIKYRMISATGKLVLTPSNLKYDGATFHQEPLYFNGHEIGIKAVDKYENYHPVVWLTATTMPVQKHRSVQRQNHVPHYHQDQW